MYDTNDRKLFQEVFSPGLDPATNQRVAAIRRNLAVFRCEFVLDKEIVDGIRVSITGLDYLTPEGQRVYDELKRQTEEQPQTA